MQRHRSTPHPCAPKPTTFRCVVQTQRRFILANANIHGPNLSSSDLDPTIEKKCNDTDPPHTRVRRSLLLFDASSKRKRVLFWRTRTYMAPTCPARIWIQPLKIDATTPIHPTLVCAEAYYFSMRRPNANAFYFGERAHTWRQPVQLGFGSNH